MKDLHSNEHPQLIWMQVVLRLYTMLNRLHHVEQVCCRPLLLEELFLYKQQKLHMGAS